MNSNVELVSKVPCFKCLFWDWKKESHLLCKPGECEALTDWIFKEVEDCRQSEEAGLAVVSAWLVRMHEKPKNLR